MITLVIGSITGADAEYICNAANGIGPMGAGVAGAIRRAAGPKPQDYAFWICKNVKEYVNNGRVDAIPKGIYWANQDRSEELTNFISSYTAPYPGDLYMTTAGDLNYDGIIHLVTMKNPGDRTSIIVVEQCLKNLIEYCQYFGIKKVALPALGTGIGGLRLDLVAKAYEDILGPVEDIEFVVVDINPDFINCFEID